MSPNNKSEYVENNFLDKNIENGISLTDRGKEYSEI